MRKNISNDYQKIYADLMQYYETLIFLDPNYINIIPMVEPGPVLRQHYIEILMDYENNK